MVRYWNRKKDPHNIEELMVAEHKRLIEVNEDHIDTIKYLYNEKADLCAAHAKEVLALTEAKQEVEKRLRDVIAQNNGLIDCHEPTKLYYASYCSAYQIKHNLEVADDSTYARYMLVNSLLGEQDSYKRVKRAMTLSCEYNGKLCDIKEHEFPYKLSVKSKKGLYTLYYDPDKQFKTLVEASATPKIDEWCLCDDDALIDKLDHSLYKALKEAQQELRAKYEKEQEGSADD